MPHYRRTIELARRVAPGGRAQGVDIAAALLARAQEHSAAARVDNVEFLHADVQSSDLGRAQFDGAFSRFGVMFFADPVSAFSNIRRSMIGGAVLSFVCWQPVTSNHWMLVPTQAAVATLGWAPEEPEPGTPGPFSLSDRDEIRRILRAAGFRNIRIEAHSDLIRTPEEAIPDFADSALRVGAVQRMLTGAGAETVERVRIAIQDALCARLHSGEVALSRSVWLVGAGA
jgi:SAM-dependent methyltransferase